MMALFCMYYLGYVDIYGPLLNNEGAGDFDDREGISATRL